MDVICEPFNTFCPPFFRERDRYAWDALYGIATQRAVENYDITGVRLDHYPEFIKALGMTKKARVLVYSQPHIFVL